MDSPQIPPTSPIRTDSVSTNPKPPHGVPDPSLKREYVENVQDGENNLCVKKSRTENNSNVVALNVKPLAVVELVKPKLSRQFWKAGDDKDDEHVPYDCSNDAAVRVHPQFLHANATSHKWALGALAELLDNSLDEACNGATYVHVDSTKDKRDEKSNILIIEDNGGGMNPSRFRECLSLGYSRKRNMSNTVGQYGNGFKTSTMRLGADAIVFSRCRGTDGNKPTQSIGMLSYTFLYETRKCEAIVPTIDFELVENKWKEIIYSSTDDWFDNLETIVKWSPYSSQDDLFDQFDSLGEQGTRIVIYNLWEDDEGKLELDFDTDPHDIQLRGANRDKKNIEMAKDYPNSRHFLTYRHSLRSYASILYLRLPPNFRIILRGKDVEHHNLLDDMMMTENTTYKPKCSAERSSDQNLVAAIKLGFVKDAYHHIDIQGFNVYHKNRLIKPFWRVWNAAGSDGRGVIGILEANFIQPAHNKQGFERTAGLAKLENRLIQHQKTYWSSKCHHIGYAPRRKQKTHESFVTETTQKPDQRSEVPLNYANYNKRPSSSIATPSNCRQNVESSNRNQSVQGHTQENAVDIKPDIGMKNQKQGLGISINETRSVNLEAELLKVKEESAKQKALLEFKLVAAIKLGFVKDAYHHIDIQGFNVYHKNRLIKPFWRVWNAAGSDGRGVIGILEANFIQPAHNKQGFERTAGLAKLENRLIQHQKTYWSSKCHHIGYAPRRKQKTHESFVTETTQKPDQRSEVPLNYANYNKRPSSSIATPSNCRQNVESSNRNQSVQGHTQENAVDIKPDIGLKNQKQGLGISINETRSVNLEAELLKVKEESAKQKALLEFKLVEAETRIQSLEKVHKTSGTYLQEERSRRDVVENDLRKELRGAYYQIDQLKKKVTSLEADKAYCKKMHAIKHNF